VPQLVEDFGRGSVETFTAVYSSRSQPVPNPQSSRPPVRLSSEVRLRASRTGLYQGALRVLMPSREWLAAVAAAVSVTMGSRKVVNSSG
jgi:hypothetical protein